MDDRGISSDGIKKQVVTLEYYIDEIKNCLNNMSMHFNSLKDAYVGTGCDAISAKYDLLRDNYDTIYKKLNVFCERLDEVVINYQLQDQKTSSYVDSKS